MRLAHYPHDNAFTEACDELGLPVYEEALTWFDCGGSTWTESLKLALRRAIHNHPSIFAWGDGMGLLGAAILSVGFSASLVWICQDT